MMLTHPCESVTDGRKKTVFFLRPQCGLAVLPVVLYLVFAVAMAAVVPPLETPDAPSHILYIRHLHDGGSLPGPEQASEGEGYPATLYEWHQVPFYYVFQNHVLRLRSLIGEVDFPSFDEGQSPAFSFAVPSARMNVPRWPWWETKPGYESVFLLRLVNILVFGLPCVALAGRLGYLLTGDHDFAAMWASSLALMPQFVFVQISIQNDSAAILWVTLAVGLLLTMPRAHEKPEDSRIVLVGVFVGLALISKLTALPVLAFLGLWVLSYGRRRSTSLIRVILLLAAPIVTIVGIYLLFGNGHLLSSIHYLGATRLTWQTPLTVVDTFRLLVSSFWGRFGWMNVPLPSAVVGGLVFLSGVGLIRAGIRYWMKQWPLESVFVRSAVAWMAVGVMLQLLYVSVSFLPIGQPQGRFVFPFLVPFLGLVSLGWYPRRRRARRLVSWSIICGGVVLEGLTLWILYSVYWGR